MTRSLTFGLVGTGHWAQITHAPALASADGIDFAAVWGRNAGAAAELAGRYHAAAYNDLSEFMVNVDAVAFAVPPDVQAPIAIRAARAGKHLLLEKPMAISPTDADALVDAVEQANVASVVFFTARFQADVRAWLAEVAATGGWAGGCAIWLGSALRAGNPFNTAWRRDKGGLWDLAPHLISLLWASLGPVQSVTAQAGLADVTHLILRHDPERTPQRRTRRPVSLGGGRAVSGPRRDRPADDAAADRPHRAGGQCPVGADRSPLRRPLRPRGRPRSGRRATTDRHTPLSLPTSVPLRAVEGPPTHRRLPARATCTPGE